MSFRAHTPSRSGSASTGFSRSRAFTLVLFAFFAIAMMLSLAFGLQVYRAISDGKAQTEAQRVAYGTLANAVKGNDAFGAIAIGEYEGNALLSLAQRDPSGDYVTRLFVHDGQLMQQYTRADAPLSAEEAHALFPTSAFAVDCDENGLLTMRTDAATVSVALRCPQPQLAADSGSDSGEGGAL